MKAYILANRICRHHVPVYLHYQTVTESGINLVIEIVLDFGEKCGNH
jgi:hypothetical protein